MMKKNSANILLVESAADVPKRLLKKYREVYVYDGDVKGAKKLPDDILDMMDKHLSYYKAGKVIDQVYVRVVKHHESTVLNEVIGDPRGYLYAKRTLLFALGKIYLSIILAEKLKARCGIKEEVDFIPRRFSYELYEILLKNSDVVPLNINIPMWYLNKMRRRDAMRGRFLRVALIIYPEILIVLMNWLSFHSPKTKKYQYGVHIWNSWISSVEPPYRMDVLENWCGVVPANVLYIMDSKIDKINLERIKSSGYDCCYFRNMLREFSVWTYLKKVYPQAVCVAKMLYASGGSKMLLSEICFKTLHGYLMWKMFYALYNVGTCISVQEPGNCLKTLFQKKHGSRSVFIFTSTSYDPLYREEMNTHDDSYYSFMVFDEVFSSLMSNAYLKKNINFVGKYIDCGLFRSDVVFNVKNNNVLKREIRRILCVPEGKRIVGFFDDQIGSGGFISNEEGCKMMSDVYKFIDTNKNYFLIYKSRGFNTYSESSDIRKTIDRIRNHERVQHLEKIPHGYQPWQIMGLCDLVIGVFASSVSHEAVAGGVKTICYVPPEKLNKSAFITHTFPHFCATGYDELEKNADHWLNQCSEEELHIFLDTYIKKYVDSHLDGKALYRLHTFLEMEAAVV